MINPFASKCEYLPWLRRRERKGGLPDHVDPPPYLLFAKPFRRMEGGGVRREYPAGIRR